MACSQSPDRDCLSAVDALLLGGSKVMQGVRDTIRKVAPSDAPVLITGPSGSGKECAARAIHAESTRDNAPFVAVNCGAVPHDLLESELFGHEKGSFTGAIASRTGRFEEADGGTLFLDEIGDMPLEMQVKLLRVLGEGQLTRVGGSGSRPIDVRIVSATHRDLKHGVASGAFRDDLYYRLAVLPVAMPSLSARRDDIPLLTRSFFREAGPGMSIHLSPSAYARLAEHDWPGNVRELRNVVMRALVFFAGVTVDADMIDALIDRPSAGRRWQTSSHIAHGLPNAGIDLRAVLAGIEDRYIGEALDRSGGVVADAARLLGLRRTTLVEKMRRLDGASVHSGLNSPPNSGDWR